MKQKTVLLMLLFWGVSLSAQDYATYQFSAEVNYRFELTDGSQFIGTFLEKDEGSVYIKTSSLPRVQIPIQNIVKIELVDESQIKNGKYWFPNPNETRYLFGPSAFNLKKGEGYYQNTYLFLNSFNVGVTNSFSIGGGFEIMSAFEEGLFNTAVVFTPKVGFEITEKLHLGCGALIAALPNFDSDGEKSIAGIFYGIGTVGSRDHNATLGVGWGFFEGEYADRPIITLSGMTRIARKAALVSENWIVPDGDNGYYTVVSYGIRFFGEKLAVDLAFLNNADISEAFFLGIPYVDFVVKF